MTVGTSENGELRKLKSKETGSTLPRFVPYISVSE